MDEVKRTRQYVKHKRCACVQGEWNFDLVYFAFARVPPENVKLSPYFRLRRQARAVRAIRERVVLAGSGTCAGLLHMPSA